MKITIETSSGEDDLKIKRMFKADDAYIAIFDIVNEVFRPNRKHGYSDNWINEALDAANTKSVVSRMDGIETPAGEELIYLLEKKFFAILERHSINLNDLE